ncbi:tetratricopeptide repeat protein (plasmid) [Thioclava litoralis]|uniref:Tetratricopeptide repeat protein n=1 Tax=Thioclava litoralis TaxID=3076557 RepID=A0ABZ1E4E9_9RHOB|nr:tetratricopeptide repeat protein [Thioclava sp. FTW29]
MSAPACRASLCEVQLGLGQMLLSAGNPEAAWEAFSAAARQDEPRAFNMLGRIAHLGLRGGRKDLRLAIAMYRRAIARGHVWARFNLADLYLQAPAPFGDPAEAVALYHQAAEAGLDKAYNMLGQCYETGRGVAPDLPRARMYYDIGAGAGDCWASFNLGRLAALAGQEARACHYWTEALGQGFRGFWAGLAEAIEGFGFPAAAALAQKARALEAQGRNGG